MHGYVGAMGGPYGGHERTVGCMGVGEWPHGGHGEPWAVCGLGFVENEQWWR